MKLRHWQASVCVALTLVSTIPPAAISQAAAQQTTTLSNQQANPTAPAAPQGVQNDTTGNPALPQAPAPKLTEPLFLRPTFKDYSKGKLGFPNPLRWYTATNYPAPRLSNAPRLDDLLRDGKIYLSLSDAVTLALENNFDIAIARINLDIADTDVLRARAGSNLRGVSAGIVSNTLGGTSSTITGGGGPGGTSQGTGGTGTGANGLVLSTNGSGPVPYNMDPVLTGALEYQAQSQQQSNLLFSGGLPSIYTDTSTYNFTYQQGFGTGTLFNLGFNNSRVSTNNPFDTFSPAITTGFTATVTQHLLQGFGTGIQDRFILQAKNNRRITDSAFRQQLLYTVNQVENIYWGLVSAYEDEQAKERALTQSTQLTEDNRKQLQIGTLAPLDVVNSDASVAADKQALILSQTNLEYQQLIMKQAIAHNLNDPQISAAPIVPTDRVALDRLPEEDQPVDALGMAPGEQAGHDRAPGMGDDRDPVDAVPGADEADGLGELEAGIFRASERRHAVGRPVQFGIRIGKPAEAVKIQRPDMESCGAELIAPGSSVEPMRDRERGRERAAMHIKNHPIAWIGLPARRQMAQEQR